MRLHGAKDQSGVMATDIHVDATLDFDHEAVDGVRNFRFLLVAQGGEFFPETFLLPFLHRQARHVEPLDFQEDFEDLHVHSLYWFVLETIRRTTLRRDATPFRLPQQTCSLRDCRIAHPQARKLRSRASCRETTVRLCPVLRSSAKCTWP